MPDVAKFIAGMIEHGEKKRAALEAGYSPKSAHVQATQLLKRIKVKEALAEHAKKVISSGELSAERVLEEIRRLAFSNPQDLYDASGKPKPLNELTREQAAAIASIEVVRKNVESGDGVIDTVLKIRLHDKPKSLEMLAKHYSLLTERIEHAGGMVLTWKDTEE